MRCWSCGAELAYSGRAGQVKAWCWAPACPVRMFFAVGRGKDAASAAHEDMCRDESHTEWIESALSRIVDRSSARPPDL